MQGSSTRGRFERIAKHGLIIPQGFAEPSTECDVVVEIVAVGEKSQLIAGGDVFGQVVDVERAIWSQPKLPDRVMVDLLGRLHGADLKGETRGVK